MDGSTEKVWSTDEGPVVITQRGKLVFVSESFDLPVARKLATLIFAGQGSGPLRNASNTPAAGNTLADSNHVPDTMSAPFVRFLSNCGVTKAAVDAAFQTTR